MQLASRDHPRLLCRSGVQAGDTLAALTAGELEKGESCYVNFA
jgi:hypothetical protein